MKLSYCITVVCFFCVFLHPIFSQTLYFPPNTGNDWDTISPSSLNWCNEKVENLYGYLDTTNTKAFILLQDGKIVLENYFNNHTPTSAWQWASAAKTITAFMVGIAQQENHLKISDTSSMYLGEQWTSLLPNQEQKITIFNQLTMTSGLDDAVPDHFCTLSSCLIYKADAGSRWAYHNGPYTLLDKVIENATGLTLNNYTTQKLKNPIGMSGLFVPVGYNNIFYSNAQSMARFGLLMLNKGNWNGNQILTDKEFYNQMINSSQNLNKSYGYLWWLNGKSSYMIPNTQFVFNGPLNPNAPEDMFVAIGKDGQFLNIVPSKNMVWLRMGESSNSDFVPFLMNDKIWEYINDLNCDPVSGNHMNNLQNNLKIYPNPCLEKVNFEAQESISKIEIYNALGQLIQILEANNKIVSLSTNQLKQGLYSAKIYYQSGKIFYGKFIKE